MGPWKWSELFGVHVQTARTVIESIMWLEKTILAIAVAGKIISGRDVDVHDGSDVGDCQRCVKNESCVCKRRGSS